MVNFCLSCLLPSSLRLSRLSRGVSSASSNRHWRIISDFEVNLSPFGARACCYIGSGGPTRTPSAPPRTFLFNPSCPRVFLTSASVVIFFPPLFGVSCTISIRCKNVSFFIHPWFVWGVIHDFFPAFPLDITTFIQFHFALGVYMKNVPWTKTSTTPPRVTWLSASAMCRLWTSKETLLKLT